MFLAAAGERTKQIKLGTGVVSLPYHHPLLVADRIVQLDHMTNGRAIFGTGPGALTVDAAMLGLNPLILRERQDEALGILLPLLRGEEVTYECEWFKINKGVLQILPLQENMEIVAASSVSPSGMRLAGKHGLGVISLATSAAAGSKALAKQWDFAEEAARQHGKTVDRSQWRILLHFHLADSVKQAEAEAGRGYQHWHNDYIIASLTTDGKGRVEDLGELLAQTKSDEVGKGRTVIIGTPDEAIKAIRNLYELTGGFGAVLGLAHDWADLHAQRRSWELFARYVIPEINGFTRGLKASFDYTVKNRMELMTPQYAAIAKASEAKK
jgi:limonene 1,2-monooxygenase